MVPSINKSNQHRCSVIKAFLEILQISKENWSLFLIKLQACRDSNRGVLLWNLRKFKGHLFWRTSATNYFWINLLTSELTCNEQCSHHIETNHLICYSDIVHWYTYIFSSTHIKNSFSAILCFFSFISIWRKN